MSRLCLDQHELLQAFSEKGWACVSDSRRVRAGDVFVAWPGLAHDSRDYVEAALKAGARYVVLDSEGLQERYAQAAWLNDPRIVRVKGLQALCGHWLSAYKDHPSDRLAVIAVTGTNGKTSLAWYLSHAFDRLNKACAMIGTLGVGRQGQPLRATGLTTPDPMVIHEVLEACCREQAWGCVIEASSIGLKEARLAGVSIDTAVFTNFTQDHLDYHLSMQAYWQAKQSLFDQDIKRAVINIDDEKGRVLNALLKERATVDVWTYGRLGARVQARSFAFSSQGLELTVVENDAQGQALGQWSWRFPFVGQHNLYNALAWWSTLRAHGVSPEALIEVALHLPPVPGRLEPVELTTQQQALCPSVWIDYAHTPEALSLVLQSLAPLVAERQGQLWCVMGCGGNRDRLKRPLMGKAAQQGADQVILTSDNPRDEAPLAIIEEILQGLDERSNVKVIEDRACAIEQAIASAAVQDVVLLAGKGHERTQEIKGQYFSFCDQEVAYQALMKRVSLRSVQKEGV